MSSDQRHDAVNLRRRQAVGAVFYAVFLAATVTGVVLLVVLLVQVFAQGADHLKLDFLTNFPSRRPQQAGVKSALWGTVWVIGLTALFSIPVGVGAAIYLEEYARPSRINTLIEVNISNLAGVPSIVYGMLGLALFVRWLALGRSVLSGALTLSLVILPVVIVASREALRAVSNSLRQASFALGATRWQTIRDHVLPSALPGILTGVILSLSRAIGETAPLMLIGALSFVPFTPKSPFDSFTVLPVQIYSWAARPQKAFHELAAAGIIVLLVVLLTMNALAILMRQRFQRNHP